jgi:hypothetical protein
VTAAGLHPFGEQAVEGLEALRQRLQLRLLAEQALGTGCLGAAGLAIVISLQEPLFYRHRTASFC